MYFGREDDIDQEIPNLGAAGLVQFTWPQVPLEALGLDEYTWWFLHYLSQVRSEEGVLAPGVHALALVTHAMYMKGGSNQLQDVEGGDFAKLDKHLEYIVTRYPEIEFATMSEAVLEFLDYYTPSLLAVVESDTEKVSATGTRLSFHLRLLGADIPVSPTHRHQVFVQPPAWILPEQVESIRILADGREIARHPGLPAPCAPLPFTVGRRGDYELVLHLRDSVAPAAADHPSSQPASAPRPTPPVGQASPATAPLFQVPAPHLGEVRRAGESPQAGDSATVVLPPGLLRLLLRPLAGGTEPLGRGFHPLGNLTYGVAACAAAAACGDPQPLQPQEWQVEQVKAKWNNPVGSEAALVGHAELTEVQEEGVEANVRTTDEATGTVFLSGTIRLKRKNAGA